MKLPIKDILLFYSKARRHYYIHSPFAYDFCEKVLYTDKNFYKTDQIESIRKEEQLNNTSVLGTDPGAGSRHNRKGRTIGYLAKYASMKPQWGKLLFKTVDYFKPSYILELGTCLGIGTAYLAAALPTAKVISIEGNPQLCAEAGKNLAQLNIANVSILNSFFEDALTQTQLNIPRLDLALIDGNHTFEATVNYFEQLLTMSHSNSIFIFDDIFWSKDMVNAWHYILSNDYVTTTFQFSRMGYVFINPDLPKQQFRLLL